jgi:hypothetical protein
MASKICSYHGLLVEKLATIETVVNFIKERLEEDRERVRGHIHEGEREGGFRDRLQEVELLLNNIEKTKWLHLFVAAILGGLVARVAPDMIWQLIETLIRSLWHGG